LQVVRLLKEKSDDEANWDRVERVLTEAPRQLAAERPTRQFQSVEDISNGKLHSSQNNEFVVRYDDDRLRKAVFYIHKHLESTIGVQDVVNAVCVSRRWLEYAFRAAFGVSPSQYLRCVRLELARYRLLMNPDTTINRIALSTGFSSGRQFSVSFRQHFGCTPSECRRQKLGEVGSGTGSF